jgi:glycosyltransferase involved in cell wall biosynthesis
LIIDGNSSDDTLEIVSGYGSRVAKVVSEPDQGIYDAMNKGVLLASGEIIGILNSDDMFADSSVIADVVQGFVESSAECLYGDLVFVDAVDVERVVRRWRASPYHSGAFRKGWHPPHPSFFMKKAAYRKIGLFDTAIPFAADFDLMLRAIEVHHIKSHYLPRVCVRMRVGGATTGSFKNIAAGNIAVLRSFRKYDIRINRVFYLLRRIIPKLIDVLKNRLGVIVKEVS